MMAPRGRAALAALVVGAVRATVLYSDDCAGAAAGTGECIYALEDTTEWSNLTATLSYTGSGKISALEVDVPHGMVYWTDRSNGEVWGSTLGAGFADARVLIDVLKMLMGWLTPLDASGGLGPCGSSLIRA